MKEIALLTKDEVSQVKENLLNERQVSFLLKKTPARFVKERPAKGGGKWKYVSGSYVRKVLNLMFGWDWSFEIMEQLILDGEAIVKGRLSVTANGRTIVKTQFGNKDIVYKKSDQKPLSIGNDLKAAATDCLKKCAAELGIAADVYNPDEFIEAVVIEDATLETLLELVKDKLDKISDDLMKDVDRILDTANGNKEPIVKSFSKLHKELLKL